MYVSPIYATYYTNKYQQRQAKTPCFTSNANNVVKSTRPIVNEIIERFNAGNFIGDVKNVQFSAAELFKILSARKTQNGETPLHTHYMHDTWRKQLLFCLKEDKEATQNLFMMRNDNGETPFDKAGYAGQKFIFECFKDEPEKLVQLLTNVDNKGTPSVHKLNLDYTSEFKDNKDLLKKVLTCKNEKGLNPITETVKNYFSTRFFPTDKVSKFMPEDKELAKYIINDNLSQWNKLMHGWSEVYSYLMDTFNDDENFLVDICCNNRAVGTRPNYDFSYINYDKFYTDFCNNDYFIKKFSEDTLNGVSLPIKMLSKHNAIEYFDDYITKVKEEDFIKMLFRDDNREYLQFDEMRHRLFNALQKNPDLMAKTVEHDIELDRPFLVNNLENIVKLVDYFEMTNNSEMAKKVLAKSGEDSYYGFVYNHEYSPAEEAEVLYNWLLLNNKYGNKKTRKFSGRVLERVFFGDNKPEVDVSKLKVNSEAEFAKYLTSLENYTDIKNRLKEILKNPNTTEEHDFIEKVIKLSEENLLENKFDTNNLLFNDEKILDTIIMLKKEQPAVFTSIISELRDKYPDVSLLHLFADVVPTEENLAKYNKALYILKSKNIDYNSKDGMKISFVEKIMNTENERLLELIEGKDIEYEPMLDFAYERISDPVFKDKVKNLNFVFTDLEEAIRVKSTKSFARIIKQIKSPLCSKKYKEKLINDVLAINNNKIRNEMILNIFKTTGAI